MQKSEVNYSKVKNRYLDDVVTIDAKTIFIAIVGFLLSRSMIIGLFVPFGMALFVVSIKLNKYKITIFTTVLLGTLTADVNFESKIKYIGIMLIFTMMSRYIRKCKSNISLASFTMSIMIALSTIQIVLTKAYTYDAIGYLIESMILFVGVYILSYALDLIININNKTIIKPEEIIALSFMSIFTIMGIGDFSIFSVSIMSVLANIIILTASIIGGSVSGAITGIIVGIAFMLNSVVTSVYMGIYAFSGLIGGFFNKINRVICILTYTSTWLIVYLYIGNVSSNKEKILELLIASLIVVAIPKNFLNKIENLFRISSQPNDIVNDYLTRNKDIANNKLIDMYKAYDELANVFDSIRQKEKVVDANDVASIIDFVHKDKCSKCSMKRKCWEVKFNYTYTMLNNILSRLEDVGELKLSDIDDEFKKECISPEEVVQITNYYYKMFVIDYNWSVKFAESRKLIVNQIKSVSQSLESLSKEFSSSDIIDLAKEKEIYTQLQRYSINVDKVTYVNKLNNDFEIVIDKRICSSGQACENHITKVVSEFVGEKLSCQKIGCRSLSGKCSVRLNKSQKYRAITEVARMPRSGYVFCGDNNTHMEINNGKYMVALSDGMGKGKKANKESAITIDILEKMIDANIDEEAVINTINNMLLLKSEEDEMFSTLDLGIIDLKRGILKTIKMGACSTYIKRKENKVDLISSASFPVGILSEIGVDKKSVNIEMGDLIVMVSDGILDAGIKNNLGDNWLIYFLKELSTSNPKEIADKILDRALEIQNQIVEDDMTVLVTKICKE